MCLYRGFFCLSWLSFASLPQLNSLLRAASLCRERDLGHYELEAMNCAEAGKRRKAKKGRRNHDKDTGMFAFTFLTITSFPATHGNIIIEKLNFLIERARYPNKPGSKIARFTRKPTFLATAQSFVITSEYTPGMILALYIRDTHCC